MTGMKILAIDTALQAASACVYQDSAGAPEACETMRMQRGQAEALLPLIDKIMTQVEGKLARPWGWLPSRCRA